MVSPHHADGHRPSSRDTEPENMNCCHVYSQPDDIDRLALVSPERRWGKMREDWPRLFRVFGTTVRQEIRLLRHQHSTFVCYILLDRNCINRTAGDSSAFHQSSYCVRRCSSCSCICCCCPLLLSVLLSLPLLLLLGSTALLSD